MLSDGLARPPLQEFGLIETLALGAAALVPAPGLQPAQLPLLAARHGATLVAGRAETLRRMLGAAPPGWSSLRLGLVTDRPDADLAADWQARTGTALHRLDAGPRG